MTTPTPPSKPDLTPEQAAESLAARLDDRVAAADAMKELTALIARARAGEELAKVGRHAFQSLKCALSEKPGANLASPARALMLSGDIVALDAALSAWDAACREGGKGGGG